MRPSLRTVLLMVLACVAACSKGGGVALEGKVSYGGEPVDVGTITFIPTGGSGIKSGGLIEAGSYIVDPKVGPSPGPHRVEISWKKATGQKYQNEYGEEIQKRQEALPEKYHTQSTLTAEIKPGKNVLDFSLEK